MLSDYLLFKLQLENKALELGFDVFELKLTILQEFSELRLKPLVFLISNKHQSLGLVLKKPVATLS